MDFTHLSSNLKLKTNFNADSALRLKDINSITGVVDNSVTSLQALIFSNNNPEHDDLDPTKFDVTGITSGYDSKCFIFDVKKEYKLNLSSDITDHYVEDNIAIQDHIGLKPIILEVVGSIGEVALSEVIDKEKNSRKVAGEIGVGETQNNAKGNIFNSVDSYLGRMGSLTSFTPNIINQSLDIYNTAKFGYATVSKIINLDKQDKIKSGFDYTEDYDEETIKITKQFSYIDWFKTQWWNRASFTIVTPYGVLTDMYIMDLSASQPENTRYVTNLNIKFKQIRKAQVISRGRKVSQVRETQGAKTFDLGSLEVPDLYKKMIENMAAQPPAQAGMVTQETAAEFEAYKQEVTASLNVKPLEGVTTLQNTLLNRGMMGQVQFKPPIMPVTGGVL